MIVIFILIEFSVTVAIIFLALYIWSVKDGQFDDMSTPAIRILFDDDELKEQKKDNTKTITKINSETN